MEKLEQLLATGDSENTIILVPNHSVGRFLSDTVYRRHQQQGLQVWSRPNVFTFSAWMKNLWNQVPVNAGLERPVLLGPTLELAVWQDIIRESPWSNVLMQVASLASNASQANRLMHQWGIDRSALDGFWLDESRALRSWVDTFNKQCQQQGWLPEYRLPEYLLDLPAGIIDWPGRLLCYALTDLSPRQQDFLDAVASFGCRIESLEPEALNRSAARTRLPDSDQEYRYAANWAKALLEESPQATIAIALPDYPNQVVDLKISLQRVFSASCLYPSLVENPAYEGSDSPALASHPLVDTALRILAQSRHRVDLPEFGKILHSIYLAGAEQEIMERSRLDAYLRSMGESTPSLGFVARTIYDREEELYRFECPQLLQRLADWRHAIDAIPKKQMPSDWAASFSGLLVALGWPANALTDKTESDIVNRWNDVLSQLCTLDTVTGPFEMETALRWVRRMSSEATIPRPARPVAIHIIRIDDAAVLSFDHLWVCGLDDHTWPPSARPNPLLPVAIQRQAGIPGTNSNTVAVQAKQTVADLVVRSRNVVISHADFEGDHALRPCPYISELESVEPEMLVTPTQTNAEKLFHARQAETVSEQTAPLQREQARGGTSILKNQAACPFRAYVDHRLAAVAPEEPELGLDAAERGTLLHDVLEVVWSRLGSHSGLLEADEFERERLIVDATNEALAKMVRRKPETITPKFREIELERLVTRVMEWLNLEQERDAFTVLKPEAERSIELAGLEMKMRVDRIDQNSVGDRIIIDYKTGEASVSSWFGERPDEPQLPLYALTETRAGHTVAAISFAQVRPGDLAFKGLSNADDQLPGVKSVGKHARTREHGSWSTLIEQWQATLERLAGDFVNGVATVDPKSSNTCRYCEFSSICRINELNHRLGRLQSDAGDEEGNNDD